MEWASPMQSREVVPQSQLYKDNTLSIINVDNTVSTMKVYEQNGALNVEIPDYNNEEITLSIYDMSGKTVLQRNIRSAKTQIDIGRISKGVYLVSVQTKNYSNTVRYIVR